MTARRVDDKMITCDCTEWKVYYSGGYWRHDRREKAGQEILLEVTFPWGNEKWHIPAVYVCGKGLVVEYCVEIPLGKVQKFIDSEWSEEDSPFNVDFHSKIIWNGTEISQKQGYGLSWIPESCLPDEMENEPEAKALLAHYNLDASCAWVFQRFSYPWKSRRKPKMQSLELKLERERTAIQGIHFREPKVGDSIAFAHPITGEEHCLFVMEYEKTRLDFDDSLSEEYEFPKEHTAMTYMLTPDLSEREFQVRDVLENDEPRRKVKEENGGTSSVAIIGGADGPTAFFVSAGSPRKPHMALSALHFEPVDEVEWKAVFYEKLLEDKVLTLI